MRLGLFISIIILAAEVAQAQDLPAILMTKKFERGIYQNFSEFLNNSPSIKYAFTIKSGGGIASAMLDLKIIEFELLDTIISKSIKDNFWGLSTGDSVYVNAANYKNESRYLLIEEIDRYCYWYDYSEKAINGDPTTTIPIRKAVILNINNGKFYYLDRSLTEKILENDKELLSAYKEAEGKIRPSVNTQFSSIQRQASGRNFTKKSECKTLHIS